MSEVSQQERLEVKSLLVRSISIILLVGSIALPFFNFEGLVTTQAITVSLLIMVLVGCREGRRILTYLQNNAVKTVLICMGSLVLFFILVIIVRLASLGIHNLWSYGGITCKALSILTGVGLITAIPVIGTQVIPAIVKEWTGEKLDD